jgi:hypothetical protein
MSKNDKSRFSIDQIAALTELPRRTVRYYIQTGLVDRPEGSARGPTTSRSMSSNCRGRRVRAGT